MNPLKVLALAGLNGWTCLAFAVACTAWGLDRWDSRRHQREHRQLTQQLRDHPAALAQMQELGRSPSGCRSWIPLALFGVLVLAVVLAGLASHLFT